MENAEISKTSDEIINELFSSLNVPLSPKPADPEDGAHRGEQGSTHTGDSDNTEDEESDSRSSESEGDPKAVAEEVQEGIKAQKTEKVKAQKKKKEKKKKKKKHKKKEDGGRHKHRKKRKKESCLETAEEAKLASDILQDMKVRNQALIQKIIIQEELKKNKAKEIKEEEGEKKSKSRSPTLPEQNKTQITDSESKQPEPMSDSKWKEGLQAPASKILQARTSKSPTPVHQASLKSEKDGVLSSGTPQKSSSQPSSGLHSLQARSPRSGSRSNSVQTNSETQMASDAHKRKASPRSRSPTPRLSKRQKSSDSPSKSSSPKTPSKHTPPSGTKRRSRSTSTKDSKSKSHRKSRSRSRRSQSRSQRSQSRSRRSRSRSHKRSRSRSHKRSRSKSRKRSWSRSRKRSRSRSCKRSRSKSRKRSRSRSHRRSRSRSHKRSRSRSRRSRSRSTKRSKSQSTWSGSKSRRRSRSKSRRSRSRRKSGSRSRSRSCRGPSPVKERFDMFAVMRERANKLAELKNQNVPNCSLGSLLLSAAGVQGGASEGTAPALEHIPLPVPTPDPSSIPLPQQLSSLSKSPKKEEDHGGVSAEPGLEVKTIPVPGAAGDSVSQEQDATKAKDGSKYKQEEGSDKGKMKTIIIKSLKDSLVFQQAQEEAERKAKEKVHQPALTEEGHGAADDREEEHHQATQEDHHQEQTDDDGNKDDNEEEETTEEEESSQEEGKKKIAREMEEKAKEQMHTQRENMEEEGKEEGREEKTEEGKETDEEEEKATQYPKTSSEKKSIPDEAKEASIIKSAAENMGNSIEGKGKLEEIVNREKEEEKRKADSRKNSEEKVEEKARGKRDKTEETEAKNGHPSEEDTANKMEEGEIISDKDEVATKPSSKTHSKKKSKKDKNSSKEKKKSKKEKTKSKEEKKKVYERRREHDRPKSRSRDKHRSRHHSSSGTKDHSHDRRHKKRSRSRSRDRSSRQHRRSHSRSRSKSKTRSKRRRDSTADLRDKVTRKRLLEIARRNAVYLMQNGCLPPNVEQEQLVKIKAGGKSVDELTDFCKQLVASGNYSDVDVSDPSLSSGEEDNNPDKPFSSARHPFSVRDSKPILMNIRNAPMLPTKTNAERLAGQAKLREQFPVSSGSQHRTKGEMSSSDGKQLTESDWVPVPPKEKKEEDKVFPKPEAPAVDISQIVSTRLSAMRKLQDNPNDSEAIKTLNNVQKEMQNWALSKQEPGQFTGTTGVKVLSQEELSAGHQAWARKEQFKEAAPVRPQFGLKMLQKMGWSPGEGLGKNKEGTTEPLLLDVKMDKKGFHAQEEVTPKKQPIPLVKDLSGKHPVSALVELCSKRKWSPPDFEMVFDCGPDHKKNFLMKVMVNGQEFKPSVAASTKKMAKANAAAAYLQSLGLYPKDPNNPL